MEIGNDHTAAAQKPELRLKKRKYEEATSGEKYKLYLHATKNPHLKQRELAEWFEETFHKAINQSTVSRNLKKFKASPPSPIKEISGSSPASTFPPSLIPPAAVAAKKEVADEPTKMEIDDKELSDKSDFGELGKKLHNWYLQAKSQAKVEDSRILEKAKEIHHELHPGSEIGDFSEDWLKSWKESHGILLEEMKLEVRELTIEETTEHERSSADKTLSSDSEPSPEAEEFKTGSGIDSMRKQKGNEESEDKRRKKEIKRLRKEIEKRDIQMVKARIRKDALLRRVEELEKELAASGVKG